MSRVLNIFGFQQPTGAETGATEIKITSSNGDIVHYDVIGVQEPDGSFVLPQVPINCDQQYIVDLIGPQLIRRIHFRVNSNVVPLEATQLMLEIPPLAIIEETADDIEAGQNYYEASGNIIAQLNPVED